MKKCITALLTKEQVELVNVQFLTRYNYIILHIILQIHKRNSEMLKTSL